MDSKMPLVIAYSGSLDARQIKSSNRLLKAVKNLFWTYKHDTVDPSTRTAYYLIQTVKVLKNTYGILPEELCIDLWGNIHPLNIQQSKEAGVFEYFKFNQYLPKDQSLMRLGQADILFLPLEKSNVKGQGNLFIPGKLFEYLHAKKPILALCEPSDCREIIEKSGMGICIEPDQPELIAKCLFPIVKNKNLLLGLKPNDEFIETFSFKNKTKELIAVLNKLSVNRI